MPTEILSKIVWQKPHAPTLKKVILISERTFVSLISWYVRKREIVMF